MNVDWLDQIKWNADGLVPAIAVDATTGTTLMMAWMNRDSLTQTVRSGSVVYWSRSRQSLWRKGEQSGHTQVLRELRLDCDGDTLLLVVEQRGGIACHTGRQRCFYRVYNDGEWQDAEPVLQDPAEIYRDRS